ncbi:MAG: TetR/AcrR family transcriptional regulator [Eubacteriaceae bacterium]|nr:TetR/AcrR family transcriptional regulator [Eubacteriaceae bacterium]
MAVYKSGEISKNKIITACKELFYLQGYRKTTYKDICKKADSNPGLINYYFKTKIKIAEIIYENFFVDIKSGVEKYLLDKFGSYDLQVGTSIEHLLLSNLISGDTNLSRFYYDMCLEGIEYDMQIFNCFFKLHVDKYHLPLSEDQIKLLTVANSSISIGIAKKNLEGYLHLSKDEIFEFRTRSIYHSMGIPDERIDEIIKEAYRIYSGMDVQLKDYFVVQIS